MNEYTQYGGTRCFCEVSPNIIQAEHWKFEALFHPSIQAVNNDNEGVPFPPSVQVHPHSPAVIRMTPAIPFVFLI